MKFSEDTKKQIIEGFLEVIQRLADLDFQKRTWVEGIGPDCDSFDDVVCDFIDPAKDIIKNYKEFGLTDQQHHILNRYYSIFVKFADKNDYPSEFIDTPEWQQIVDEAKKVLEAFNYKKA